MENISPIVMHLKEILAENPALSVFLDAVKEFGDIIEPENLFQQILKICIRIFKAEGGSVMLLTGDKQELVIKSAEGLRADIVGQARIKFGEGIAGWVAKEIEPLLIIGENTDTRFRSLKDKNRIIRDSIISPITIGQRVYGVISLNNKIGGMFTNRDKELLAVIATVAAMAIEKIELSKRAALQLRELDITNDITRSLDSLIEKDVYRAIIEILKRRITFSLLSMLFINDRVIKITPLEPIDDTFIEEMAAQVCKTASILSREEMKASQMRLQVESDFPPFKLKEPCHVGSFLDMPLSSRAKVFGVLYIGSTVENAFTEDNLRFFTIVAEQAGIFLGNARRYAEAIEKLNLP